jgi:tetratricopeptide (TPR) repeat protein
MDQLGAGAEAAILTAAFGHYQAGKTDAAAAAFRQSLAINPKRPIVLLMLGQILAETDGSAAEALFRRCLDVDPGNVFALNHLGQLHQSRGENVAAIALFEQAAALDPGFAPAFNNIGVSLHRLGRRAAALAAFDHALVIAPDMVGVQGNRGQLLGDLGRWSDAAAAFRHSAESQPDSAEVWRDLGAAYYQAKLLPAAEDACRRAIALDPDDVEAILQLAVIVERGGRGCEAQRLFAEASRRRGIVVSLCRGEQAQARVLILCVRGANNVPTDHLFDPQRFTTITLSLPPPGEPPASTDALITALPEFDVVFNAVGEGEADDPHLAQVAAVAARLGRPVLNPPHSIPPTGRDALPALFAGIPRLIVPTTRRKSRAELIVAADFPLPFLIRPTGAHGGSDLCKIESTAGLADYLGLVPFDAFYVTDYVDSAGGDGFYRKFRFIFIDRQAYAYHLAIHNNWLVHYFRADMDQEPWMKREEEAFLADAGSAFPDGLLDAVAEAARRLDLDYGGMDCGLTPDNRVVVFEANACMLLHLHDSPETFAYKHRAVPQMVDAIARMVITALRP